MEYNNDGGEIREGQENYLEPELAILCFRCQMVGADFKKKLPGLYVYNIDISDNVRRKLFELKNMQDELIKTREALLPENSELIKACNSICSYNITRIIPKETRH